MITKKFQIALSFYLQFTRCFPLLVLLCLGCCNKIPQSGWLQQQKFVSHSSGGWTSNIRVPARLGSGKSSGFVFLMRPHGTEKEVERANFLMPLLRVNPIKRNSCPMTVSKPISQRAPSPNTIALRVRASIYEMGRWEEETQFSPWHFAFRDNFYLP